VDGANHHNHIDSRYAFYLIPPYAVSKAITEIHTMLRKQFGFTAADRFQVHATIKGFYKKTDSPVTSTIAELDTVMAQQRPFPIHFSGFRIDDIGIGLNVSNINGKPNAPLHQFRGEIVDIIRPTIAPDCDFAASDLGPTFEAHLTLAFRDITPSIYDDVLAWLEDAPIPTEPFIAKDFHFLQIFCDDWSGNWWETLSWKLLKTWHLKA